MLALFAIVVCLINTFEELNRWLAYCESNLFRGYIHLNLNYSIKHAHHGCSSIITEHLFLFYFNVVQENWTEWSTWSDCSKSCGMGMRVRQRHCSTGQRCSGWSKEHIACYNFCKVTKEDEKSERNEIYSKGILYLPNAVALFAAIILTGVAVTMVIRNCHK